MNEKTKFIPSTLFLALCIGSAVIGMTILSPALPLIKADLQASGEAVQQLLTAYLIALALGHLICGPLSDRTGRRPVMLVGALLFFVAGFATMFEQSIESLVVFRFLQGFGGAACMAMGRAIVNDVFERADSARQFSTISTVLAIAPALSLAFGGVLAETFGWRSTMALLAGIGLILTVSVFYLCKETNHQRLSKFNVRSMLTAYTTVLKNKIFFCWAMAGGMQTGIFFSLNAFLAYQYQRHGYSMSEFGLWFAITPTFYVLGNTVNRLWFVSRGIELAALTGCLLSLVSLVSMLVTQALGFTHALSLAIPCALFGFANGITLANTTAGSIAAAGKHAGTGTGLAGAWQMATGGIAGALIIALGGDQVFSVAANVLIIMSMISIACMAMIRIDMQARLN